LGPEKKHMQPPALLFCSK